MNIPEITTRTNARRPVHSLLPAWKGILELHRFLDGHDDYPMRVRDKKKLALLRVDFNERVDAIMLQVQRAIRETHDKHWSGP